MTKNFPRLHFSWSVWSSVQKPIMLWGFKLSSIHSGSCHDFDFSVENKFQCKSIHVSRHSRQFLWTFSSIWFKWKLSNLQKPLQNQPLKSLKFLKSLKDSSLLSIQLIKLQPSSPLSTISPSFFPSIFRCHWKWQWNFRVIFSALDLKIIFSPSAKKTTSAQLNLNHNDSNSNGFL